jgi:hypothetical protein
MPIVAADGSSSVASTQSVVVAATTRSQRAVRSA